jgi:hypothetical protein
LPQKLYTACPVTSNITFVPDIFLHQKSRGRCPF